MHKINKQVALFVKKITDMLTHESLSHFKEKVKMQKSTEIKFITRKVIKDHS